MNLLVRSLLLFATTAFLWANPSAGAQAKPPNVVFIMMDDISAQAFKPYGGIQHFKTPTIDRLADEGLVFEHCHSMPMCGPTRQVLLTGSSLLRSNLPAGKPMIPRILKRAGYRTGIAGKWMVKGAKPDPIGFGFDEAFLMVNGYRYWDSPVVVWNSGGLFNDLNQPQNAPLKRGEWTVPIGEGEGHAKILRGQYGPEKICDFAVDFIERHAGKPFFLYYPLKLPHYPHPATPLSKDITEEDKFIEHEYMKMQTYPPPRPRSMEFFADSIAYVDLIVGRIEQTLKKRGVLESTIVMITADNGTAPYATAPGIKKIPGAKGTTLDGGTRVPMIVSWPGTIQPGRRCADIVQFVDVLPTLAEAAKIDLPEEAGFDGVSFFPQIMGRPGRSREWLYFDGGNHPSPTSQTLKGVVSYDCSKEALADKYHRWVRGRRYKLYNDGRLHDLLNDYEERHPIAPGAGNAEAEAARRDYQAVLDRYASMRKDPRKESEPVHVFGTDSGKR